MPCMLQNEAAVIRSLQDRFFTAKQLAGSYDGKFRNTIGNVFIGVDGQVN